ISKEATNQRKRTETQIQKKKRKSEICFGLILSLSLSGPWFFIALMRWGGVCFFLYVCGCVVFKSVCLFVFSCLFKCVYMCVGVYVCAQPVCKLTFVVVFGWVVIILGRAFTHLS